MPGPKEKEVWVLRYVNCEPNTFTHDTIDARVFEAYGLTEVAIQDFEHVDTDIINSSILLGATAQNLYDVKYQKNVYPRVVLVGEQTCQKQMWLRNTESGTSKLCATFDGEKRQVSFTYYDTSRVKKGKVQQRKGMRGDSYSVLNSENDVPGTSAVQMPMRTPPIVTVGR